MKDLRVTTLSDYRSHVLVIPIGSIESHGPLPPALDCLIAECLAARCSIEEAVLAPPIPVSTSWEHHGLAPTISVSVDTFAKYLRELVESTSKHFRAILLLVAHGGAKPVAYAVCRELIAKGVRVAMLSIHSCIEDYLRSRGIEVEPIHADPIEASLALACSPTGIEGVAPASTEIVKQILNELKPRRPWLEPWTWRDIAERYTVDRIPGSIELGKEILEACCRELKRVIEELKR